MDETHTSYHTMEQAETASIVPEAGVYGETMQSPQLSVPPGEVDALRSKMVSVLVFIMKHSYAATLIVMMVSSLVINLIQKNAIQCWFDVGAASQTVAQYQTNIG